MQAQLTTFITRHWPLVAVAAFAIYSTAVDSLPEPMPTSGMFYQWVYRFAHGLAFNLMTAFGKIGRTPWPGEMPVAQGGVVVPGPTSPYIVGSRSNPFPDFPKNPDEGKK